MRLVSLKSFMLVTAFLAATSASLLIAEQQDQKHGRTDRKTMAAKTTPADASVTVKKFQVTASEGRIVPNTIRVKKGERVRITFVSRDSSYGIKFKDFDIKKSVNSERPAVVEFTPTTSGSFPFRCTRTWGVKHWSNNGTLVVE